ncbi:Acg family FMN-binding oxidoreductase [Streptomyces wuyuanensis]|uniref:Nitroreductase family protein n=1 Tax=Streptomyces wuyuanensis TaxID=1196353 RepID=A0A1H0B8M7_9ACTN|nr:nitroreductase family protein [Streptomyces wuyuanensis]SDN42020.1 Nitroreductase family protein [Streptomyces wuyuanensis]
MTTQLEVETVTDLVKDATAAPSMHNAQPWKFRYVTEERLLMLRADPERAMPRSDPGNRALHIGCGAAVLNLRVAAAHAGLTLQTRLLPDPKDPLLLAEVRLAAASGPLRDEEGLARLRPAVHQRHTSRHPFADRDVPEAVRTALAEAATGEGATLLFPGLWHAETVLELVHDAESRDVLDPERREDLIRWTRLGDEADTAVDGVPEYAFGPRKRDGRAPLRDFAARRPVADRGSATFERTPHLALLSTPGDTPTDWLHAGQALERVLLEATSAGLATSLTSHPLESPELRWLARDPAIGTGKVQMVLRLGYGPQGPATPRRPVRDVLEIV